MNNTELLRKESAEVRQALAKHILLMKGLIKKEEVDKLRIPDFQAKEIIDDYNKTLAN